MEKYHLDALIKEYYSYQYITPGTMNLLPTIKTQCKEAGIQGKWHYWWTHTVTYDFLVCGFGHISTLSRNSTFLYHLQKHTFVIRVHLFLITRLRFHFSCCRHKFHLLYSLPSAILIHERQKQSLTHVFTRDPWNALSTILLFYDPIRLLGYNRLITFVYAIHLPVISYVNTWARPRTSF